MSRRKLITKPLYTAYRTIEWFYSGKKPARYSKLSGNEANMYVTCFYLDLEGNIYKSIVDNYMQEKEQALRENSEI